MNMKDVFSLPLLTDNRDLVDVNNHVYADFDVDFPDGETKAIAAALAINNHDALIALARYVSTTLSENSHNSAVAKRVATELLDKIKAESK